MEKNSSIYKSELMYVLKIIKQVFMSILENITKLNWYFKASEL